MKIQLTRKEIHMVLDSKLHLIPLTLSKIEITTTAKYHFHLLIGKDEASEEEVGKVSVEKATV